MSIVENEKSEKPGKKVEPYNPLDKKNLGRSVAEALLLAPVLPFSMEGTKDIVGAGVYAIYYVGEFPAYAPLASQNRNERFERPIYVGKAIPKGGRKGGVTSVAAAGDALRSRLRQHLKSVDDAGNLKVEDFYFRSLIVDDIWIPLGENMMIDLFKPVWNLVIDGFGNKDPGARRATQYMSPWDVLHPGRAFTAKLATHPTPVAVLEEKIEKFFAGSLPETELVREEDRTTDEAP